MKFSIIISTLNAAKELHKTLDSILSQSHKEYEINVIDGASTDGTQEIIRIYENKFSNKLRWISEPDNGIYDAMNKGIDMSSGEWIYFIGSGDTFYNANALKEVHNNIILHDCDLVYGNVQWGQNGNIYDGEFTREKLIEKNICHQAIFYKRNIFKHLGKFDTKYTVLADWAHNLKWFNDEQIKFCYINVIVAQFKLGGWSQEVLDKNFYSDMGNLIKKYFPHKYYKVFKKIKGREMKITKSSFSWKLWHWKNKIKFAVLNPKKFSKKYKKNR